MKRRHDAPLMRLPTTRRVVPSASADAPWRAILRRTRRGRRRLDMLASHTELAPGPAVVFARDGREPTRAELMLLTSPRCMPRIERD